MTTPDFLAERGVTEIHNDMLAALPEDFDKSEGQHAYNFTRPTALIAAELCQQIVPNALRLIFPASAYGEWLDYHGDVRGITRRAAVASSGELLLTVKIGTEIPAGTQFATASADGQPSVVFQSDEKMYAETESVSLSVTCTKTGTVGNVAAHTVVFKLTKIDGILAVDNPEPITGGTEIEDDDTLRDRIVTFDATKSISYVGSIADYKRWSKEVPGVGDVTVIAAQDTSGLVTVIITDSNGDPANDALCEAVYNYIMSPDEPELRLTAPNALLQVLPPETLAVTVSATVEIEATSTLEAVKDGFIAAAQAYLSTARADEEIRYSQIGKILAGVDGVYDYDNLTINGGDSNVAIGLTELPQLDREGLNLTLGVVS